MKCGRRTNFVRPENRVPDTFYDGRRDSRAGDRRRSVDHSRKSASKSGNVELAHHMVRPAPCLLDMPGKPSPTAVSNLNDSHRDNVGQLSTCPKSIRAAPKSI